MATVVIRNPSHRRAVRFGGRTLAGRYSGGRHTVSVSVKEFVGVPVQGRIRTGQLVVESFSDPSQAAAWASGGLDALRALLSGTASAGSKPQVESRPVEVVAPPPPPAPAPVEPPAPVDRPNYTREQLEEMPWSGEGSIRDLAADLGVEGRTKAALVEGILALQEI